MSTSPSPGSGIVAWVSSKLPRLGAPSGLLFSSTWRFTPETIDTLPRLRATRRGKPSFARRRGGGLAALNPPAELPSGSFHEGDHARRTGIAAFDPQGESHQHEPVGADLRKIGHELDQRNALVEQRQVVRDPDLTGIELHAPPERLFRKHVHRHGGYAALGHQLAHA